MNVQRAKMFDGGRLVVPAAFRKQLGIDPGDTVLMELSGDELRIRPLNAGIRSAQERLRKYLPKDASLADELIADRRAEAKRD